MCQDAEHRVGIRIGKVYGFAALIGNCHRTHHHVDFPRQKRRNQTVKSNIFNFDCLACALREILHEIDAHTGRIALLILAFKGRVSELHPDHKRRFFKRISR